MSQDSDIDYEQARLDPGAVFGTPEALRDLGGLLREQKIDILRRWAYDAAELNVAEEEGMQDGESACAADILVVLDTLIGGYDVEHTPPTRQHGV